MNDRYPKLAEALAKFGNAARVVDNFFPPIDPSSGSFLFSQPHYFRYFPDKERAFLGAGSYGKVYRGISAAADSEHEPIRACKLLSKELIGKRDLEIQHLVVELSVLFLAAKHGVATLNKLAPVGKDSNGEDEFAIFHDRDYIYIVLEMTKCSPHFGTITRTEPTETSIYTQFLHLFGKYSPGRLVKYPEYAKYQMQQIERYGGAAAAMKQQEVYFDRVVKDLTKIQTILSRSPDAKPNVLAGPQGSLFDLIWSYYFENYGGGVPELKAKIIIKQCLEAIAWLHSKGLVHRDMKTENVIFGETRHCQPLVDSKDRSKILGTRVTETIDVQVLDFGLAKVISQPESVAAPSESATAGGGDDDDDDDADCFEDDEDDDASAPAPAPPKPLSEQKEVKRWITTQANTRIYTPFEVITGEMEVVGNPGSKWLSSDEDLKKMDVYGVGTILFCLVNGAPPFILSERENRLPEKEMIQALQKKMREGPRFNPKVSAACKEFCLHLLELDVKNRPTAKDALAHPFLAEVVNSDPTVVCEYTFDRWIDGKLNGEKITFRQDHEASPTTKQDFSLDLDDVHAAIAGLRIADQEKPPEAPEVDQQEKEEIEEELQEKQESLVVGRNQVSTNLALRDQEDGGDYVGKTQS